MKFWRTIAAFALVGAFPAASALAALAPKAPAAAQYATSPCGASVNKAVADGFTLCVEMLADTNNNVGNGFPWENSGFFFSTYRNQFLYPSDTILDAAKISCDIRSISARSSSFVGGSTNTYVDFPNGQPSVLRVTQNLSPSLVPTFATNSALDVQTYGEELGTNANPLTISTANGPKGSLLSICTTCADPTAWITPINIETWTAADGGLMLESTHSVGGANAGAGVWDTTTETFGGGQGCPEPERAFGSGSFANPDHLTTALGVDHFAFVWIYEGAAPPPAATVEQQIKEIVRLLLTPEGMRCSGLDLNPGNDRIEDTPISWPNGRFVDPIQPQVGYASADSRMIITGDELADDLRSTGWLP